MNIITLDFETYYDKKYSLSKMTTEEYIRDPQFEVIGVAVQVDEGRPVWFSGTKEKTKEFLAKWELDKHIVVAHNAMFDMAILNWHFDIRPKRIVDTLSMARALHSIEVGGSLAALAEYYQLGEKGTEVINALGKRRLDFTAEELSRYGEYCKNDVTLTYKLFDVLAAGFPVSELKLIDLTIRMFTEPKLELNRALLSTHLATLESHKMRFLMDYDRGDLMSNPKFADLLRSLHVDPPMKISPTTGKETYAFSKTDEAFKALLEHENLLVQELVAARLGVKSTIEETRTQRFIDISGRGTLPIPLRYYAAHTGRWGGCLVADTAVTVYDPLHGMQDKRIVDVLPDDLVWDGVEFVPHSGVAFSGFAEVIEWDGVRGTEDHVVFTDAGETSLRTAMQGSHTIQTGGRPTQDDVDTAARLTRGHQTKD